MVTIDGYYIEQFPDANKVVIYLPKFNASSTGSSSCSSYDRSKLALSASELAELLTLAKSSYSQCGDDGTVESIDISKKLEMLDSSFPSIDLVATGNNIRKLRKAAGLTVLELTYALKLNSNQSIYKWQRGDSTPTVDNLVALAYLFNVKVDDILVLNDN